MTISTWSDSGVLDCPCSALSPSISLKKILTENDKFMLDTVLIQTDITTVNFYPRDAMTVPVPAIGLSVLLSVYHNSGFYGNSWTKRAVFLHRLKASSHLSNTVLKGNLSISKSKGTFLWNFVPNSGLMTVGDCWRNRGRRLARLLRVPSLRRLRSCAVRTTLRRRVRMNSNQSSSTQPDHPPLHGSYIRGEM